MAGSMWVTAARSTPSSAPTRSTVHQSASRGTARRVKLRRVSSGSNVTASRELASARKLWTSEVRFWSSMSVQVPNQRMTRPWGSCTGMARARNQRQTPSSRRQRDSASKGSPVVRL
ncbi:hypothetical protein ACN28S_02105 [Cystobacter fuscus]